MRMTAMRQRLSGPIQAFQAHFTTRGVRFIGTRLFGFRIEVSGRENVPAGQPLIVAGGPHRNWVDGFLLLVALPPQPRVVFLASENVSDRWWKRVLVRLAGGFEPVSTTSVLNREALDAALLVLARGDRLGIFPEGWDHLDGPHAGDRTIPSRSGLCRSAIRTLRAAGRPRRQQTALAGQDAPRAHRDRRWTLRQWTRERRRNRPGAMGYARACRSSFRRSPRDPARATALAMADRSLQLKRSRDKPSSDTGGWEAR